MIYYLPFFNSSTEMRHYFELSYPKQIVEIFIDNIIVARTSNAILLKEVGLKLYDPVYYIPRMDIEMKYLSKTSTESSCPIKGNASYYSFKNTDILIEDIAWSYEVAKIGAEVIENRLAFRSDQVTFKLIPNNGQ